METRKVLSSLAYFSIFFLGFIFPAVLYLVSDDRNVKDHAKAAFVSHCIPVVFFILSVIVFFGLGVSGLHMEHMDAAAPGRFILMVLVVGVTVLVSLIVTVWNVYKGIKVLMES